MNRSIPIIRYVLVPLFASGWFLYPRILHAADAEFKPGDTVEVEQGRDTLTGTVVEVDDRSGWIEIRFDPDELDLPKSFPERARKEMSTRRYPSSRVSLVENAKPEKSNDDRPVPAKSPKLGESRTWSDQSGKFRVTAKFVRTSGTRVVLLKDDGKQIEVPLDKLSDADAKYVQNLKDEEENPFWEPTAANPITTKKANWKEVKVVRPQKFSKWSFVPPVVDESESLKLANMGNAEIELSEIPSSELFFEGVESIRVSADGRRAIVCREQGKVGRDKKQYAQLIDLEAGKSLGMAALPKNSKALDSFPDDGLVMYRPDIFGFGKNTKLTLARIEENFLVPVSQWEPYIHESSEVSRDIDGGRFLDANRVLTINQHGDALTVWDIAATKAILNIPIATSIDLKTSLSNDRKLLLIKMRSGIALIDFVAGKHVATLPVDEKFGWQIRQVSVSDDYKRLAALSYGELRVWDLTSGDEIEGIAHSISDYPSSIDWAGPYLLLNSRYLFDLDRRILLWEYMGFPNFQTMATIRDGRMWMVARDYSNHPTPLYSLTFPHSEALAKAKSLPPLEKLLAIQPGAEVAIQIDVDPAIASADEIRESVAAGLEEAGFQVVDDSTLIVRAICKAQEQQTIRINTGDRFSPRPEDIQERTIIPHASYLEMKLDGETLWKKGHISQPGMLILLNEGESLDQALERLTQPNIKIITEAKYTSHVTRPGKASANGAYGISRFEGGQLVEATAAGEEAVFE